MNLTFVAQTRLHRKDFNAFSRLFSPQKFHKGVDCDVAQQAQAI